MRKATLEECVAFNHMRACSAANKALSDAMLTKGADLTEPAAAWARELKDKGYAFGPQGLYIINETCDT